MENLNTPDKSPLVHLTTALGRRACE